MPPVSSSPDRDPLLDPQDPAEAGDPLPELAQLRQDLATCKQTLQQLQQQQQALKQREEQLRLALAGGDLGLWDWNLITGEAYFSPRWLEMLGYGPDQLPGQISSWKRLIHPDDKSRVMAVLAAHIGDSHVPYVFDYRLQTQGGDWAWIANSGQVVARDPAGHPLRMVGIHQDIHGRKQAEVDLQTQLERYASAIAGSQDGLWDWNVRTNEVYFSPRFKEIIGYSPQEPFHDFAAWESRLHPADHDWVLDTLQQHLEQRIPYGVEYRLRTKDGHYCWTYARGQAIWDETGQVMRMAGSISDITDRKQMEAALRESEARYSSLTNDVLDNSEVGIFILDAAFRVVWVNQALARYFGVPREAIIGQDKRRLIQEQVQYIFEQPDIFASTVLATYDNNTYVENFECHVLPGENRQERWLEHLSQPIQLGLYAGGRIEHYTDITERKDAEAELQQQNQRAQLLAELTLNIRQSLQLEDILRTAVVEVQRLLQADRVLIFRLYADGSGTVVQEAVMPSWTVTLDQEIFDPCFGAEYIEQYRQGRIAMVADIEQADLQPCHIEFLRQFEVKANLVVPILQQDEIWGLLIAHQCAQPRQWTRVEAQLLAQLANQIGIAIAQSQFLENLGEMVTNRTTELVMANETLQHELRERQRVETALRESEAALRHNEEQLRLITDSLPVLIAYVDAQQQYRFNNKAYEDWFGFSRSDMYGQHIRDLMGDPLYQQIQAHIEAVLAGERTSFEIEVPDPDGIFHWLSANYIPHIVASGEVQGFFASIHDISVLKAVERMKDEFISIVSHELRTPLTSIHGSLKLLATGQLGTLSPEGQQMLEIADENTDRLVRLVSDVLDLQRIESGKVQMEKRRCDAADLMLQATQAMQGMAQHQQMALVTTPVSAPLQVDPDYIVQTLTNLLSNAIKFSSVGDTVWLTAEIQSQAAHIVPPSTPYTLPPKSHLIFSIRDQGQGIPEDKLETVFERFHQVDASDSRKKGGTGLGLAICRKIVEQHGGRIWAESVLGEGSTFYVMLPLDGVR